MKCEICHNREAGNVLVVENGKELYVCNGCAEKYRAKARSDKPEAGGGRDSAVHELLSATLKFMKTIAEGDCEINGEKLRDKCPKCELSFKSFDQTGIAGCPECYNAFAPAMDGKYLRSQYSRHHVGGKAAASPATKLTPGYLKREIDKAVASEDYKRAAELKRQLDSLDS